MLGEGGGDTKLIYLVCFGERETIIFLIIISFLNNYSNLYLCFINFFSPILGDCGILITL